MADRPRVPCILNPIAGRGRAAAAWPAVRDELEQSGADWTLLETHAAGDAWELAAWAACSGAPAIVVVGGDGTLNEAVNGMLQSGRDARHTSLAIVPAGNGNDFAKPLGLRVGDPRAAARLVLHGRRRPVDVGCVNGRWFVNGVGMGLDGRVALETRGLRRLRGKPMYVVALLRALRAHRAAALRISADGRDQDVAVTMVNVTNGPCHGGGFWICPHARIDDGALDLCIARAMAPLRVAWLALLVMRGAHVGHPLVSFHTAARVTVNSRAPLPVHVDGEILGSGLTSLEIQVLPGRLHVLVAQ